MRCGESWGSSLDRRMGEGSKRMERVCARGDVGSDAPWRMSSRLGKEDIWGLIEIGANTNTDFSRWLSYYSHWIHIYSKVADRLSLQDTLSSCRILDHLFYAGVLYQLAGSPGILSR